MSSRSTAGGILLLERWSIPLGIVALQTVMVAAIIGIGNEAEYRYWDDRFSLSVSRNVDLDATDDRHATAADVGAILDGVPGTWSDVPQAYPDGGEGALSSLADAMHNLDDAIKRARSIDFGGAGTGAFGWGIEMRVTIFVVVAYVVAATRSRTNGSARGLRILSHFQRH
ncbi:hypothetical protein [Gordonia sp. SL306]|uniref:hypothetical protein n=1 Tax=Gordonia sp. SL306 TaxID=2995145 RepID=UPI00226D6FF9|nr:hypothetical protein [Gordonia sp. SL306]WAC57573.1 hypothetical protein OVA31_10235 [Gordonia sp. SL306]